ncbi:MAG: PadR family transcriptional regulator, partial [Clostridia bacterium]|nr:PadR family transcriptional regulator [Clostridia bacterium]
MSESNKAINESENAKLFRTRMDIFVLNALDEKEGQGYGYDVISYIQDHTKGHYKIKSISTIYNILKRLEAAGYVSSEKGGGESYGAARVYYTLTPAGKEYLERDKKEWKYIRTLLNNLVSDEDFDLDNEEPPYSASVLKPLTKRSREGAGEEEPLPVYDSAESIPAAPVEDTFEDRAPVFEQIEEPDEVYEEPAATQTVTFTNSKPAYVPDFTVRENYNFASGADIKEEPKIIRPILPVANDMDKKVDLDVSFAAPKETPAPASYDVAFDRHVPETESMLLSPYMERLKKNLQTEGFVLSSFTPSQKANTIRYFFVNKILRDTMITSFLYLVVTLLITNLFKNVFGITLTTMHVLAAIGFVATLACVCAYLKEPKKKKKDATNIKLLNSVLWMAFVVLYLAVVVYYLFTSQYSFSSTQMYAPAIILSSIPFAGLMF